MGFKRQFEKFLQRIPKSRDYDKRGTGEFEQVFSVAQLALASHCTSHCTSLTLVSHHLSHLTTHHIMDSLLEREYETMKLARTAIQATTISAEFSFKYGIGLYIKS